MRPRDYYEWRRRERWRDWMAIAGYILLFVAIIGLFVFGIAYSIEQADKCKSQGYTYYKGRCFDHQIHQ